MKTVFPWMAPIHQAERILYNGKLSHNAKSGAILEGEENIDIIVHKTNGKEELVATIPNKRTSYNALR